MLDVLAGDVVEVESLSDIPLADDAEGWDALVLVPYRQLAERGFDAPNDGAPLLVMTVGSQDRIPLADALTRLPNAPTVPAGGHFDLDDDAYADLVRRIVDDEIGTGEGANFVIKRSFLADISEWTPQAALSFFRRLLQREQQAYWTFVIHDGRTTLIGATPERHVSLRDGTAVMNPISGTYRYPSSGPTLHGVLEFLADRKETDELFMVVDEELKMMARICPGGGRILGPDLKEMKRVAHTQYLIEGRTEMDVREILRETMFAPTVTGSPLESAARVIARYEPRGRRYYSGVVALIGRGPQGDRQLDSAILIRTAEIDRAGRMRIDVGATLVRHSEPLAEAAETRAKVAGLLDALEPSAGTTDFGTHPEVRSELLRRNERISSFWIGRRDPLGSGVPTLPSVPALIIDAEDTFTAMLAAQLDSLGLAVEVRRFDEPYDMDSYDLIVLGPGPGDPRIAAHPKIAHLRSALDTALAARRPLLAVCLSHQVLSIRLGLELRRLQPPNQGLAREVDLFGVRERVGFYNTFAAFCDQDKIEVDGIGPVEVSQNAETGEVHALRGPRFASMQFHAESVLTVDGPRLIADAIRGVLDR
ncbi:chorismate-binding protein [Nocardia higoensis]|uniref:anthranilate synthase n=2 Tax=Nocardia higoensis TaxID=228599 RepID=A0ABS0DCL4_9NOCA|nr:anthranilate synthase family protein [Nocardia higoensis]MBF6355865.1 chorismate-binding protein [Nocardia higoensis]